MAKLSVVIVTKNEEEIIEDCLKSVKWADEIIIIDSFSTDKTVEIARRYTSKIFEDADDPRARAGVTEISKNLGMEKASNEWILILDADEIVSPELRAEIEEILERDDENFNGYYILRKCYFCGEWVKHGGWYEYAAKLVRKSKGRWPEAMHQPLQVNGELGYLRNPLIHNCYRSVSEWVIKMDKFTGLEADEMYEKGLRFSPARAIYSPLAVFFRRYFTKSGYKDGFLGFMLAVFGAFYEFVKYVKLLEKQKSKSSSRTC